MAVWELLGTEPPLAPGEERLVSVRRRGTRQKGWTWLAEPRAGAVHHPGTEPGSELGVYHRIWGSRADAELRCHLGLLDDDGEVASH